MEYKRLLKKGDVIIIAVVLLIAIVLLVVPLLRRKNGLIVVIVYDGNIIKEIDLNAVEKKYDLEIPGATLLVDRGQIYYIEADCPDQTCVKMGVLDKAGDMAACVPNKTCVYIKGSEVDAVTY